MTTFAEALEWVESKSVDELLRHFKNRRTRDDTRLMAIMGLKPHIRTLPEVRKAFIDALGDEDDGVRRLVVMALGHEATDFDTMKAMVRAERKEKSPGVRAALNAAIRQVKRSIEER